MRHLLAKLLISAAVAAVCTGAHHAAEACSTGSIPAQVLPEADADAVARNGILIATGSSGVTPQFVLETATGEAVAVTATCVGSQPKAGVTEVCTARPQVPLSPGTYRWTADGQLGTSYTDRTFTVIDALDEQPPAAGTWSVAAEADTEPGSCGEGENDIVRFHFTIDAMPEDAVFIAGPADVDAVYGASTQAGFSASTFVSWLGSYAESGCLDARLIDGAGNITQLEQSCYETSDLETSGCGCRVYGASGGRSGSCWLLLLLGLRRLCSRRARR